MRGLLAGLLLATSAAHAAPVANALQARDIDNDGTVDAYYDPARNITITADANLPKTLGVGDNPIDPGHLARLSAINWAASLNLYGVTGWRLPVALSFQCVGDEQSCWPATSELSLLDLSVFRNVPTSPGETYWLSSTVPDGMWQGRYTFWGPVYGHGQTDEGSALLSAWAVRDGDIAAIPEPSVFALLLLGLTALGCASAAKARSR
jgi:hypothetical protein